MKNLRILLLLIVTGGCISACSEDDKLTVITQETVGRGGVLRTISTEGTAWDVLDPMSTVTITVEEQDIEDGDLLREVRVFADLIDNTAESTIDPVEAQLNTIPAEEFVFGPNGLPRATFSTTLGDVATALGLILGDYNCGDQVSLRLELELTDGRMFTYTDATGNVAGGSFFSSPYMYNISLIAPLPDDDLFTGQYQLTQITPGIFGVNDYVDGVYTVESINNTTKVIRNIPTFAAFGPFGPVDVQFQLVCGEIILDPGQSVGAGCNATINSGPANVNTTYDLANPDDSDFVINFTSDEDDDCGTGTAQAGIRLTKI